MGQPHSNNSWAAAKEAAGGGNGDDGAAAAAAGDGSDVTPPANPGAQYLSPPGGDVAAAAVPATAAAGWGAGLSEPVQTVLNHGRAKVNGVVTRYSHLQHVQVGTMVARSRRGRVADSSGGEWSCDVDKLSRTAIQTPPAVVAPA